MSIFGNKELYGWEKRKLSNLCNVVNGGTPPKDNNEYWENGDILWATPSDITASKSRVISKTKECITFKGLKASSAKVLPPGSILLTSRATIGEMKINTVEMCTNQGFKSLVPFEFVDNVFLFYQLKLNIAKYQSYGVGSTFPEVNKKDTSNFTLLLPSAISEQKKIAEILTTVDNAIEKTETLIGKYKNVKQGMMQDLLTKGIDEHGNIRSEETHEFKDSPIGRIPTTWDDCLISDYISFQKSGLSRKISHEDIGVPVLTSSNIDNNSKLDVKELKYWYESDPQGANIADYVLEKGDILLCFINSIEQMGKLCIFDDIGRPCIYTTNLFRIKASTNTTPKFLYYLLLSHYVQNEIRIITKPAINQASFTKQDFAKTKVPLISVEEQTKIVEALDGANVRIETEITHLNKLTMLKQGLMQDLLTGKVRVPLEEATG